VLANAPPAERAPHRVDKLPDGDLVPAIASFGRLTRFCNVTSAIRAMTTLIIE